MMAGARRYPKPINGLDPPWLNILLSLEGWAVL